jgi:redox-sensing transcriptional repressor
MRRRSVSRPARIPEMTIHRLSVYTRCLLQLEEDGVKTISSQEMAERFNLNSAQVRKDLAYFGEFGRKGIGYEVNYLVEKIKQILKIDRHLNCALIGAGHLGIALSNYNRFTQEKLSIAAIFDNSPDKVGTSVGTLTIQPLDELEQMVRERDILIGIITVPATEAQKVADRLVEAGVKGILNFAPVSLRVPSHVSVRNADLTTELQTLAYYID